MSREIVGDDVDLASGRLGNHDLGQKVHELWAGMAWRGLAKDFSAAGLQGRVEQKGCRRGTIGGPTRHFLPTKLSPAIEAARQEVATASEAKKCFASQPTDIRKKEISEWIKTCRNPPGMVLLFTGMRTGAPLSLTRKTRNFAGFVSLAFFPTR